MESGGGGGVRPTDQTDDPLTECKRGEESKFPPVRSGVSCFLNLFDSTHRDFSSHEQLPSLRVCQPVGIGKTVETVRFPALHTSKPPNNQTSGKPKFLIEPFFKLYHPQCTRLLISLSFSFSLQLESLPLQLAATREKLRLLRVCQRLRPGDPTSRRGAGVCVLMVYLQGHRAPYVTVR